MEYGRMNNQVRNKTRKEIKNKERNIACHVEDNPKIFWKNVQDKLTRKSGIPNIRISENNSIMTILARK